MHMNSPQHPSRGDVRPSDPRLRGLSTVQQRTPQPTTTTTTPTTTMAPRPDPCLRRTKEER